MSKSQKHSDIRAGRDISGNANSIVGNNNTVIQIQKTHKKVERLSLGPDPQHNGWIKLAELVYMHIGSENYSRLFMGGMGVSGITILYAFLQGIISWIYPAVVAALVLGFSIQMYLIPGRSSCPKCKKRFALFETNRELISRKKLGKRTVENQRVIEECTYCGHKQDYIDIIEERHDDAGF